MAAAISGARHFEIFFVLVGTGVVGFGIARATTVLRAFVVAVWKYGGGAWKAKSR
jgi:hypothetical protein